MTTLPSKSPYDLIIVGGGAAGVLTALHALETAGAGRRIALIEPQSRLACGVAYATTRPEHLLNVPAQRMSGFAGRPSDFLDHLVDQDPHTPRDVLGAGFAERRHYGDYLRTRLQQARERSEAVVEVVRARADRLERIDGHWRVGLAGEGELAGGAVVLALGNTPRPLPVAGAADLGAACVGSWDFDAVAAISPSHAVCVVGSGLSMVDAVLTLARGGHRGPIHVVSRHGLLPLPHAAVDAPVELDVEALLTEGLRARVRRVRHAARLAAGSGRPWQSVMERLRPRVQALWQSLDEAEQRRFLRHVVRYWDIHRHRIPRQVDATLQRLLGTGQLRPQSGRLQDARLADGMVELTLLSSAGVEQLHVDRVVNATGVELRIERMGNPLLDDMQARGLARPGPHGIGIETAGAGAVTDHSGSPLPGVVAVGSLRIGALWESIAIPELRGQAEQAARDLLGAVPAR